MPSWAPFAHLLLAHAQLLREYALLETLQKVVNSLPARLTLALNAVRGTLRYGVINFRWEPGTSEEEMVPLVCCG